MLPASATACAAASAWAPPAPKALARAEAVALDSGAEQIRLARVEASALALAEAWLLPELCALKDAWALALDLGGWEKKGVGRRKLIDDANAEEVACRSSAHMSLSWQSHVTEQSQCCQRRTESKCSRGALSRRTYCTLRIALLRCDSTGRDCQGMAHLGKRWVDTEGHLRAAGGLSKAAGKCGACALGLCSGSCLGKCLPRKSAAVSSSLCNGLHSYESTNGSTGIAAVEQQDNRDVRRAYSK